MCSFPRRVTQLTLTTTEASASPACLGRSLPLCSKELILEWAEGMLIDGQRGFQKGRSCDGVIFSLKGPSELAGNCHAMACNGLQCL